MTFEPLDVVVVPFPFTDRAATIARRVGALCETDGQAARKALSDALAIDRS